MEPPIDNADPVDEANELLLQALAEIARKGPLYGAHCSEMAQAARNRIEELEGLLAGVTLRYGGIPLVEALEEIKDENFQLRAILNRRRDKSLEDLRAIQRLQNRAVKVDPTTVPVELYRQAQARIHELERQIAVKP